jgi:hypothetical protein
MSWLIAVIAAWVAVNLLALAMLIRSGPSDRSIQGPPTPEPQSLVIIFYRLPMA